MLKIFFIFLIGCAVVFGSPVKPAISKEKSTAQKATLTDGSTTKDVIQQSFGELLGNVGVAIKEDLKETFHKLTQRFNSAEYKEAAEELVYTLQKVNKIPEAKLHDKKITTSLEKETEKVGEAFAQMIEQALEMIEKNENGTVNAAAFKKAVHEFRKTVDKIL